jgi:hypothetical protein
MHCHARVLYISGALACGSRRAGVRRVSPEATMAEQCNGSGGGGELRRLDGGDDQQPVPQETEHRRHLCGLQHARPPCVRRICPPGWHCRGARTKAGVFFSNVLTTQLSYARCSFWHGASWLPSLKQSKNFCATSLQPFGARGKCSATRSISAMFTRTR